jgi:3-phenylpropionate/trans-cinnamate dioxygenase ferredoxin subunit
VTTWVPACHADDIETEDIIAFEHDGEQFAIYRSDDDEFYATDGYCTHEREKLCDGLVMGKTIECPKHNGRFDYTSGQAKGAPVIQNLRTYPVKVDDSGTVLIGID